MNVSVLAAVEFLSPLFLAGLLAAMIPVIIHMLQRQRAPEMRFSTLRFLKLSVEKTARKRRLRDLWLLLMRMAVVALLAIALSRPFLRGTSTLFGNRAVAVAIVLDNSPSMALADDGEVRFERARNLALDIVSHLREGDEVALLLTGGPSLQQEATYRRSENVQRLIEDASISLSAAEIPAALDNARRLLASSDAPNQELYLITDLQRSSWRDKAEPVKTPDDDSQAMPLVVVDVHRTRPVNLSVEDVEVRAAVPAVGLPMRILGTVRNGANDEQNAQLHLLIDGALVEESVPERLSAGEVRAFQFTYTPREAGIHVGRVQLVGSDASELDNQRDFVIDTQSAVQVGLVAYRANNEPPHRSAGYYLERALQPVAGDVHAVEVTWLAPELLAEEPLGGLAAVFCIDLTPSEAATRQTLIDYVSAGGILVWVCGPHTDPASLGTGELFPGRFAFPDDEADAGRHWAWLDESHPALKPLAKPASLYQSVTVDRYLMLTLPPQSPARVLARLDNGDPALVSHSVGQGTVYTLTTGAHARWTTLPLRPIFVPLVNRLILQSSAQGRGPVEVAAGHPAVFRFADEPQPVTVELTVPGVSEAIRLRSSGEAGAQQLRVSETNAAGVYHLRMIEAAHPRRFAFAVNVAAAEADPQVVDRRTLQSRLGQSALVAVDKETLDHTIQRLRAGTPLMDWFLIAVLVGGVLELVIANRTRQQEPLPLEQRAPDIRDVLKRAQLFHQLDRTTVPMR